ncbi:redoxin domain-containing protein [Salisediminibacterium halotolerans]|uniref:redoxin domain-containing protein n=1 Tax=Salisediminibacterium halotolerans TaxID=517425 RepID=UPI00241143B1|nr:redoxin domain-containing protein [Salisediminibacterium halotolerans]
MVQLSGDVEEIQDMGYDVYGISPADPTGHAQLREQNDLPFDILTDSDGEMGADTGFIDMDEEMIYRGYVAVNADTGKIAEEIDYLVGDNSEEVIETLENMQ